MRTLSYSQITEHRRCAQSWFYKYGLGLERVSETPAPERDLGSWWHALRALDSIYRGRRHGTLQYAPPTIKTVDDGPIFHTDPGIDWDVIEAAESWYNRQPLFYRENFEAALGGPLQDRLTALDAAWHNQWDADIATERPVAVEVRWERTLPNGTTLVGYVDEVYLDWKRRMLVVRDHKTHKSLGISTSLDDMMDSQLQFYAWGISEMAKEWNLGPIRATAYDRVRTTAPKTPVLTATGTLSKSITDYDLDTYALWALGPDGQGVPWGEPDTFYVSGAKKGQPKFGVYRSDPAVTERLTQRDERAKWFQRTLVPINRTLVQTHLVAAVDTADDIERSAERGEAKGEVGRNLGKNCSWCPFAEFCRAQMYGGPDGEYDLAQFGLQVRAPKPVKELA